jgi:2-hydroxy-3-keto-5-methylthiopentenyl-1-phosphate phosphatase
MNKVEKRQNYKAIVSSDWNQCLAPCGPFDPIVYNHPHLTFDLTNIFEAYTSNKITLGTANEKIRELLPEPFSIKQMDDYLDAAFLMYKGVPELIKWCESNRILFMINTTGVTGYFQRIFAKNLLPKVPVISANSMIQYPPTKTDPLQIYHLKEIEDKGKNTERAMEHYGISGRKIVLIGDSGGDGPHFKWGKKHEAYLIGSMLKQSLKNYCDKRGIEIDLLFGSTYLKDEKRNEKNEMLADFMELSSVFEKILK